MMKNKTPAERKAIAAKAAATRKRNSEALKAAKYEAKVYAGNLREKIVALETKLAALERIEKWDSNFATITGKRLLREKEIVKSSLPWDSVSGVYFLVSKNEIIYVGQSVNVFSRISQHKDKKFDRYVFIPCAVDALDKLESLYIHYLQPRMNGRDCRGEMCAPISLDELIGLNI